MSPLPNFLILGAAKAGTTTLYDLLSQHPQVYLSLVKEPMFFNRDDFYARGLEWYEKEFFTNSENFLVRGEATPHYLYWAEKVAPRLAQAIGREPVKLILTFREPAQRAYSWYWNMIKDGREPLTFPEALEAEPQRLKEQWDALYRFGSMEYGYYRGGCYASQLQIYLDHFPRSSFFFLLQEDLKNNFTPTIKALLEFLNVDAGVALQPVVSNPSSLPRSAGFHRALHNPSTIKEWVKRILPFNLRYRLKQRLAEANMRTFEYPPLDAQVAAKLRKRYTDEVDRLSTLIGRDLSHWLV